LGIVSRIRSILLSILVILILPWTVTPIYAQTQQGGYSYSISPETIVFLLVPGNMTNNLFEQTYFRVVESFSSQQQLTTTVSRHKDSPPPTASIEGIGAYASPQDLGGAKLAVSIESFSLSGNAGCSLQYTDYSTNISYYQCSGYPSGDIRYRVYVVGVPPPGIYEVGANVKAIGVIKADGSSSADVIDIPNPQVRFLLVRLNVTSVKPFQSISVEKIGSTYFFQVTSYIATVEASSYGDGSTSIWVRIRFFALNQTGNITISPEEMQTLLNMGVSLVEQAASDIQLVDLGTYNLNFQISGSGVQSREILLNVGRKVDKIVYIAEVGIENGGSTMWAGGFNVTTKILYLSINQPSGYIFGKSARVWASVGSMSQEGYSLYAYLQFTFSTSPPIQGIEGSTCSISVSPDRPSGECSVVASVGDMAPPIFNITARYSGFASISGTKIELSGDVSGQGGSIPDPKVSDYGRFLYSLLILPIAIIAIGGLLYMIYYLFGAVSDLFMRIAHHYIDLVMMGLAFLFGLYVLPIVSYNITAFILNSTDIAGSYKLPYLGGVFSGTYVDIMRGYDEAFNKIGTLLSLAQRDLGIAAASVAVIMGLVFALAIIPSLVSPIGFAAASILGPLAATMIVGIIGTFLALMYSQLGIGIMQGIIVVAIALIVVVAVLGTVLSIFPATSGLGFNLVGGAIAGTIVILVGAAVSGFMANVIYNYVNQVSIPDTFRGWEEAAAKIGLSVGSLGAYVFFSAAVKIGGAAAIIAFMGTIIGGAIASIPFFGGLIGGAIAGLSRLGRG